jgi:hypothetical protein
LKTREARCFTTLKSASGIFTSLLKFTIRKTYRNMLSRQQRDPFAPKRQPINPDAYRSKHQMRGFGPEFYMQTGESTQARKGEKHVFLPVDGKTLPQRANYAGPGTHVSDRVREQIPPVNEADRTALAHDLRYSIATTVEDIEEADRKMKAALTKILKKPGMSRKQRLSARAARGVMRTKSALEKARILKRGSFGGIGEEDSKISDEDREMFTRLAYKLGLEGYGTRLTGEGTRLTGEGTRLTGDGQPMRCVGFGQISGQTSARGRVSGKKRGRSEMEGGIFPFIPILAGLVVKVAAGAAVSAAVGELTDKIRGKGAIDSFIEKKLVGAASDYFGDKIRGKGTALTGSGVVSSVVGKVKKAFKTFTSAQKNRLSTIYNKFKNDPAKLVEALKPFVEEIAAKVLDKAGIENEMGGKIKASDVTADVLAQIRAGIQEDLTSAISEGTIGGMEGQGWFSDLVNKAKSGVKAVSKYVQITPAGKKAIQEQAAKLIKKIPLDSKQKDLVMSMAFEAVSSPERAEDPAWIKEWGRKLAPEGKKLANQLLKSQGVPVMLV